MATPAERRAEMAARAKAAAQGAGVGEASVTCRGGRHFPVSRKDTALLVVDMQCHLHSMFRAQFGEDADSHSALSGVEQLLSACRAAGLTIAYTRSFRYCAEIRDDLVGTDDEGYAIHPRLRPMEGDIVVDKWTFGAFDSTPLEQELRARGIDRILLCGVFTQSSVYSSAVQAVDRFFRVCLVEDATGSLDLSLRDAAIRLLNEPQARGGHNVQVGLYFSEVTTLASVKEALTPLGSLPPPQCEAATEADTKRRKVEAAVLPCRRAEMVARAKAVAGGLQPADATVPCRGGRAFNLAQKDTALVIIDMQTDFLCSEGRIGQHYKDSPIASGLEGVKRLLAACRAAGLTIAHSRSFRYGSTIRDELVGTDDQGYAIHPSLQPLDGEIVVDKWTFGAFASTPLEQELRARGVERILLCGVLTNVCVFATAVQAVDRFMRVCLVEDASAAFDGDWHATALNLIHTQQKTRSAPGEVGLYFGEIATVYDVEVALAPLATQPPAKQLEAAE